MIARTTHEERAWCFEMPVSCDDRMTRGHSVNQSGWYAIFDPVSAASLAFSAITVA
jgi:hypothetical protein